MPECPSYKIRKVRSINLSDIGSICSRCIDGRGWYLDKSLKVKLICGYYEEVYLPNWKRQKAEENLKEYVRRRLRNDRS